MGLGDGLEKGGFADVCEADLMESQRRPIIADDRVGKGVGALELTIPLFKLLPGRPRRSFSCLISFLGGILFFFA